MDLCLVDDDGVAHYFALAARDINDAAPPLTLDRIRFVNNRDQVSSVATASCSDLAM